MNRQYILLTSTALGLAVVTAACGQSITRALEPITETTKPISTARSTPTANPTQAPDTSTPTPTLPRWFVTLSANWTASPPTPTPSKTPTPTPSPTPMQTGVLQVAALGRGYGAGLDFSPDQEGYAIGSSLGVYLYDASTEKQTGFIPQEGVEYVHFSPDGRFISANSGYQLDVYSLDSRASLFQVRRPLFGDAFSPDSRYFAYLTSRGCADYYRFDCSDIVIIQDLVSNRESGALPPASSTKPVQFTQIAFNSDGSKLVGAAYDGDLYVYDFSTGSWSPGISAHAAKTASLCTSLSSPNLAATFADEGGVSIWDLSAHRQKLLLSGTSPDLRSIRFSPQGKDLVVQSALTLQVFDITTGRLVSTSDSPDPRERILTEARWNSGFLEFVNALAFSPDGSRIAVGSYANPPVLIWDTSSFSLVGKLDTSSEMLQYSHDGELLASGHRDGHLSVWATRDNSLVLQRRLPSLDSIAFSPDDGLLAFSSEGQIQILDIRRDSVTKSIKTGQNHILFLVFSSNGEQISGVDKSTFATTTWVVATGEVSHVFIPPSDQDYERALMLGDGILAMFKETGFEDNSIDLWDVVANRKIKTLNGVNDYLFISIAWTANLNLVAVTYSYGTALYCPSSSSPMYVSDEEVGIARLAFSSDSRMLAIGDDLGRTRLWDVRGIMRSPPCMAG